MNGLVIEVHMFRVQWREGKGCGGGGGRGLKMQYE